MWMINHIYHQYGEGISAEEVKRKSEEVKPSDYKTMPMLGVSELEKMFRENEGLTKKLINPDTFDKTTYIRSNSKNLRICNAVRGYCGREMSEEGDIVNKMPEKPAKIGVIVYKGKKLGKARQGDILKAIYKVEPPRGEIAPYEKYENPGFLEDISLNDTVIHDMQLNDYGMISGKIPEDFGVVSGKVPEDFGVFKGSLPPGFGLVNGTMDTTFPKEPKKEGE